MCNTQLLSTPVILTLIFVLSMGITLAYRNTKSLGKPKQYSLLGLLTVMGIVFILFLAGIVFVQSGCTI